MQIGALPCCRRKMKKIAEKFVGLKNYAYLCRRIETKNERKHDQIDSKCMVVAQLKIQKVVRSEPCVLLR